MFERERFKFFVRRARKKLDECDKLSLLVDIGVSLRERCETIPNCRIEPPFRFDNSYLGMPELQGDWTYLILSNPPYDAGIPLPVSRFFKCCLTSISIEEKQQLEICLDDWIEWIESPDFDPTIDEIEGIVRRSGLVSSRQINGLKQNEETKVESPTMGYTVRDAAIALLKLEVHSARVEYTQKDIEKCSKDIRGRGGHALNGVPELGKKGNAIVFEPESFKRRLHDILNLPQKDWDEFIDYLGIPKVLPTKK